MTTLAVVPARGASKGIPGKNLRMLAGKPLLAWILETLAQVEDLRVVVSSECEEILTWCELRGHSVVARPDVFAGDDVPVIHAAIDAARQLDHEGVVLVAQPTCPLLTPKSVMAVRDALQTADHVIAVSENERIMWDGNDVLVPRLNRQYRNPLWQETGLQAFRLGRVPLLPKPVLVPTAEALDIDTHADWHLAERALRRKRIAIHTVCSERVGTGHFWRMLALTDALAHHDVWWLPADRPGWADDVLTQRGVRRVRDDSYDLLIADALDDYTEALGTVLFETTDPRSDHAALVVNELLHDPRPNALSGPKYAVLRPEFHALPAYEVKDHVLRAFVTFGGADPANLRGRVAALLAGLDIDVRVAVGPFSGVDGQAHERIEVLAKPQMAKEMRQADLVICSQGRTMWEAAACGVPTITIAANEREARHLRCDGMLHLGLHATVTDEQILHAVRTLVGSKDLREECSATSLKVVDGKGVQRIVHAIDGLLEGL